MASIKINLIKAITSIRRNLRSRLSGTLPTRPFTALLALICLLDLKVSAGLSIPTLNNMTVARSWPIKNDNGTPFYDPTWDANDSVPLLFVAGGLAPTITISVTATYNDQLRYVMFKGEGGGLLWTGIQLVGPITNGPVVIVQPTGSGSHWPIGVQTIKNFTITWSYATAFDTNGTWSSWTAISPSTVNEVNLCLNAPTTAKLFRSVVYNACKNGGTDVTSVFNGIWGLFQSKSVSTIGGTRLYYYENGTTFGANSQDVGGLLVNTTGQCGAWQDFFSSCLLVHGIANTPAGITCLPGSDGGFIVDNWTVGTASQTNAPYLWYVDFVLPGADMAIAPMGWGDMTPNMLGIPGQGGVPSQRVFENHQVVKYNGMYYDPSYGETYRGPYDFESQTLNGYYNYIVNYPAGVGSSLDRRANNNVSRGTTFNP